ncbi:hypothetical protein F0U59_32625 [Archangium gephyra]|nr:hypothetical protein F0U59_32625 [Archangium gephyra]
MNGLRDHGDVLGFHPIGDPVTLSHHWQGIQRLPGAGGRYLAVSQSGKTKAFTVVEMGSRNTDGARFRSNRLEPHISYPATLPPGSDQAITDAWFWDMSYTHAGGMQASGNLLAVPLESSPSGENGRVVFYDMATPWSPVRLPVSQWGQTQDAGTASLAKLSDGRFLLILGRADANNLEFYRSAGGDLRSADAGFVPLDNWNEGELRSAIGDREFGDYQNLDLVTQCDGSLFLAGTHLNIATGEDWIDLFRLTEESGQAVITKVAKKHLYCGYPSPGYDSGTNRQCNLDAAGGVYVDPWGQLIVYGTEHDNDGPGSSVKMMEFRAAFPNPGCDSDINRAFVELYDDSGFSDRGLMIDYPDYTRENYSNFSSIEGFNDKASAVRYCLPHGWRARLYEHSNFGGGYRELNGRGSLNLNNVSFGDKTSSMRFVYLGY